MTFRSITQVLCDPVKEADMAERLGNDPDWRCISIGTTLVIFENRKELSSSQVLDIIIGSHESDNPREN